MLLHNDEDQDRQASITGETSTLDMLIRIKKMGPDVDVFTSTNAVNVFFAKKLRHPDVQPYVTVEHLISVCHCTMSCYDTIIIKYKIIKCPKSPLVQQTS